MQAGLAVVSNRSNQNRIEPHSVAAEHIRENAVADHRDRLRWQREVQREFQQQEWKKLANRRPTFAGVENGKDRALSVRKVRTKGKQRWEAEDVGILTSVQTWSRRTEKLMHMFTSMCDLCMDIESNT